VFNIKSNEIKELKIERGVHRISIKKIKKWNKFYSYKLDFVIDCEDVNIEIHPLNWLFSLFGSFSVLYGANFNYVPFWMKCVHVVIIGFCIDLFSRPFFFRKK
jgi:hypothetical protein